MTNPSGPNFAAGEDAALNQENWRHNQVIHYLDGLDRVNQAAIEAQELKRNGNGPKTHRSFHTRRET